MGPSGNSRPKPGSMGSARIWSMARRSSAPSRDRQEWTLPSRTSSRTRSGCSTAKRCAIVVPIERATITAGSSVRASRKAAMSSGETSGSVPIGRTCGAAVATHGDRERVDCRDQEIGQQWLEEPPRVGQTGQEQDRQGSGGAMSDPGHGDAGRQCRVSLRASEGLQSGQRVGPVGGLNHAPHLSSERQGRALRNAP